MTQQYRNNDHFLSAASSSRRKVMVGGALTRVSALRVDFGVGRTEITSGSRARSSYSCDGWVGDLGVVDTSSIFGLVRGSELNPKPYISKSPVSFPEWESTRLKYISVEGGGCGRSTRSWLEMVRS